MNQVLSRHGCESHKKPARIRLRDGKLLSGWRSRTDLVAGIRPGVSIEFGQRQAAPVQVVAADVVAIDLDVHDDGIGLLDWPICPNCTRSLNPEERSVPNEYPPRYPADMRGMMKNSAVPEIRISIIRAGAIFASANARWRCSQGSARMTRLYVGGVPGAPHFHQDKGRDGHQHERGERKQKDAVDGEHRRRENHQKGEDRERDVVALPAQGKHANDHAEQRQMNGGRQENCARRRDSRRRKRRK